jgi:hypothetical protein
MPRIISAPVSSPHTSPYRNLIHYERLRNGLGHSTNSEEQDESDRGFHHPLIARMLFPRAQLDEFDSDLE